MIWFRSPYDLFIRLFAWSKVVLASKRTTYQVSFCPCSFCKAQLLFLRCNQTVSKVHLASPAGLPGCPSQQVSRSASSLQESPCFCFGTAWSYPAAPGLQTDLRVTLSSKLTSPAHYLSLSLPFPMLPCPWNQPWALLLDIDAVIEVFM